MKAAGILLNFFFPGVGSLIIGQTSQGVVQLILYFMGIVFTVTVIGAIIGLPMMLAAWIWGLVTAASYDEKPSQVHVIHSSYPPPYGGQPPYNPHPGAPHGAPPTHPGA